MKAFSLGLPGWMYWIAMPVCLGQLMSAWPRNSEPLSGRNTRGSRLTAARVPVSAVAVWISAEDEFHQAIHPIYAFV